MIYSLRQRHRRIVITLGVMLPILFCIAIAARRTVPTMTSLPGVLPSVLRQSGSTVWKRSDLFTKHLVHVRLLRESSKSGKFLLEFSGPGDFVKPDLIVYWITGDSKPTDKLPDDALLLGAFSLAVLALPPNVPTENGRVVLYSLANNEIVDISQPLQFAYSNN